MATKIPIEKGIQTLKEACQNHGGPITESVYKKTNISPTTHWFYMHFGSWNNALLAAGYAVDTPIKESHPCYSKEEILAHLENCFRKDGRLMRMSNYEASGLIPNVYAIIYKFGSWRNVLLALNTDDDILRYLRKWHFPKI